jgi:hypothetical protein
MNIEILKYLEENPFRTPNGEIKSGNRGLTVAQIEALETKYNGGNPFPKALRELLFLAGDYCYFFAPVPGGPERNQDFNRELMTEFLPTSSLWITRPFYVLSCYSVGDAFQFVYLDEGIEDPPYYDIDLETGEIRDIFPSLSACVNYYIDRVKAGRNPF